MGAGVNVEKESSADRLPGGFKPDGI